MRLAAFLITVTLLGCNSSTKLAGSSGLPQEANAEPTGETTDGGPTEFIPTDVEGTNGGGAVDVEETDVGTPFGEATDGGLDGLETRAKRFPLTMFARQSDVVFVIDNSTSMNDNIAQVRANLGAFIDQFADRSDLKLGLLTQKTTWDPEIALGLDLQPEDLLRIDTFVDHTVESHNSLALTAAAMCPTTDSGQNADRSAFVCHEQLLNGKTAEGDSQTFLPDAYFWKMLDVRGQLTSFFRADAAKAFVFVTDDEAYPYLASHFSTALARTFPDAPFQVFNIAAPPDSELVSGYPIPSRSGCELEALGREYHALSGIGRSFDLCAEDWTPIFDDVAAQVLSYARERFVLEPRSIGKVTVLKVLIDGVLLPADRYKLLDGNVLQVNLDEDVQSKMLEVFYKI